MTAIESIERRLIEGLMGAIETTKSAAAIVHTGILRGSHHMLSETNATQHVAIFISGELLLRHHASDLQGIGSGRCDIVIYPDYQVFEGCIHHVAERDPAEGWQTTAGITRRGIGQG